MKTLLTTTIAFGVVALFGSIHVPETHAAHLSVQVYSQPKLQLARHHKHRHKHYYGGSAYIYPPAVSYPVYNPYAPPPAYYYPPPPPPAYYYPYYYEQPRSGFSFFGIF